MPPVLPYARFVQFAKAVIAFALIGVALSGAPQRAAADPWPVRPITIINPVGVGGLQDFAIRYVAQALHAALGQNVIVEPRVGGAGAVGTAVAAKADPDGYTLLVTAIGPVIFRPLMEINAAPDVGRAMVPIIMIGEAPNVVLASPKLGVNTLRELLAYAKTQGNRLTIGHPGVGTMGEFCGVAFAAKTGIDGNMIAYRGAGPVISDLLGGQIEVGTPAFSPGVDTVKILALTGKERLATLPDVPTLKESGVDLECATWIAIFGPAGLPRPIVDKINAAVDNYLKKPETREAFSKVALRPIGGTPEQLRDRVAADRAFWAPIVAKPAAAK